MTKSREDLVSESHVSKSKSMLSEEAQKRMTNKLKNQANKLRGAVSKTKAIKAMGGDSSLDDSNVQAPPGYDQVNDGRLISGINAADDEN